MKAFIRIVFAAIMTLTVAVSFAVDKSKIIKLPSGVLVEHIKMGQGKSPVATDSVTVHYRGTLTNGKEFDSSYSRNKPSTFPLNQVIRCWTEGVQKMQVGGKVKLTCPADTAYGNRAIGDRIPANSTLIFEVELLKIN